MSNNAGLIELVSAALGKADIPHECYAKLTTAEGRPVSISIAIPSEEKPLAAVVCSIIEKYKELFTEQYGDEYDIIIPGLSPLAVYAATLIQATASNLKRNRDRPILCIAVIGSRAERLQKDALCNYLRESYDKVFLEKDIAELPKFVRTVLSDPSFEVMTEKLWVDKRGLKRVTIEKFPIKAVLWDSKWTIKKREEGD